MVALLLSTFATHLFAETFTVDGIRYSTTDSATVKVTGTDIKYSLSIPETVTYSDVTYTVNEIGSSAFDRNSTLYTVKLPNTIKKIGTGAFISSVLTEINLPEGLTDLGGEVFEYCSNLKAVTIPRSLVNWSFRTFYCSGLVNVEIQDGIQVIPEETFSSCASLSSIALPSGLRAVKKSAFSGCKELHEIALPESLLTIEDDAFAYSGLYDIVIPDNITEIPKECFYYCQQLQHVTLPKQLKTLGYRAFASCSMLEELALPRGTSSMGNHAIEYCNNLKKVYLPESLKIINYGNFHYGDSVSSQLKEVHIAANTNLPSVVMKSGSVISDDEFNSFSYANVGNVTLYVPKGATSLYQNATVWKEFGNIVEEDITLNIDRTKTVLVGAESQINYRVSPDVFPADITWKSSDEKVVTVDSHGVITAIAPGKANITATMATSYQNETSAICQVKVVDSADNYFESASAYFGGAKDNTISVGIDMNNQDDIIAFQCDIYLPEGLEFVTTDEGCDFALTDRASRSHTIDGNIQSDGALRLVSYSARNAAYSGDSGLLFTFSIKGASDGDYNLRISNIILTTSALKNLDVPEFDVAVKVGSQYRSSGGDVNMDGHVDVGDAATTISYILEENPKQFNVKVADVNGDGIIDIGDVAAIIDIVLDNQKQEQAPAKSVLKAPYRAQSIEADYLYANPITVAPSSQCKIGINLHNETHDYCAFQCDIMFPKGMTAVSEDDEVIVDLSSRKKRSHTIVAKYVSSGALRVVAYSNQNASFSGDDGELFSVLVDTDASFSTEPSEISISNIVFVNSTYDEEAGNSVLTNFNFPNAQIDVNQGDVNGLASVYNEDLTITLNGRQLTIISPQATQLNIVSVDGKTRTINVNQGLTTYDIPCAGFYIVNGQKLIVK
jgi:hypothetical protein